jgi:error-prone DNA polymerase
VHPYLKNRALQREGRLPPPRYPALHEALKRTLGVPIFQEQVMQICMTGAGFTADQADRLRRAMAAWKRHGDVMPFHRPIVEGMVARGYDEAFAEGIFEQVKGFGSYGFPESHAYSFALLAYFSAWIKCHEPAIFLAALLNSQPMGFYAPAQLVQDARRHGVEVRPVDVTASDVDCTLEAIETADQPAVRLGLRMVATLSGDAAARIANARRERPFADLDDLARRAALEARDLQALARADALSTLAGARRQQFWAAAGQQRGRGLLADAPLPDGVAPQLQAAPEGEEIVLDYAATGLTLRRHPVALLRERLARMGWRSAEELTKRVRNGRPARACGIVTMRQRPETAKGVIFVTLEDETGSVNVIVQLRVQQAHRQALLRSRLLGVTGDWQVSPEGVAHLLARRLQDLTPWLGSLSTTSRDFH